MKLAARTQSVQPSATLAMTARAQAMRAAGADVLGMSAGEPDFVTPAHICAAAAVAMAAGETKYTPVAGSAALRRAVVAYAQTTYGLAVTVPQVMVGTGGKQILFNAIACLLDPGDEALMASPYWVSYPDMVRFAGASPVLVAAADGLGGLPQAADWAQSIGPRTRLIILNSPSNPTGATYTAAELMAIAELLRLHPDIAIISDDIYSGLVYDGRFVGLAQVAPDLMDRLLIATGVSKSYAMTGWRIGFGIGPAPLLAAMTDLQGACTSGACSIAQAAALCALTGPQEPLDSMRAIFRGRRDRLVTGLRALPDVHIELPAGAFYAFPRIDAYLGGRVPDTQALCEHLLSQVGLALVPGAAFGSERHVRLSFACSDAAIDSGLERLGRGLSLLRGRS